MYSICGCKHASGAALQGFGAKLPQCGQQSSNTQLFVIHKLRQTLHSFDGPVLSMYQLICNTKVGIGLHSTLVPLTLRAGTSAEAHGAGVHVDGVDVDHARRRLAESPPGAHDAGRALAHLLARPTRIMLKSCDSNALKLCYKGSPLPCVQAIFPHKGQGSADNTANSNGTFHTTHSLQSRSAPGRSSAACPRRQTACPAHPAPI